jgi:hypothetical protein
MSRSTKNKRPRRRDGIRANHRKPDRRPQWAKTYQRAWKLSDEVES